MYSSFVLNAFIILALKASGVGDEMMFGGRIFQHLMVRGKKLNL